MCWAVSNASSGRYQEPANRSSTAACAKLGQRDLWRKSSIEPRTGVSPPPSTPPPSSHRKLLKKLLGGDRLRNSPLRLFPPPSERHPLHDSILRSEDVCNGFVQRRRSLEGRHRQLVLDTIITLTNTPSQLL